MDSIMERVELLKKYELSFRASDYKLKDVNLLLDFLCDNRGYVLKFEEVKSNYGGDLLRFGSLICEFGQCGLIEVMKRNSFGQILEFKFNDELWTKDLLSQK